MIMAMENPGSQGAIVASTYRALNDFIVPMLTAELWNRMGQPTAWGELIDSFNRQNMIITLKNGSCIYLRSCDRPDELRGPNLSWFFIDEAAKVPYKVWNIMVARLRVPPEKGWITTTPRGRNWVWEEFARRRRRAYAYFVGSTEENIHLSRDYIESLKDAYSGSFLAQEFYGEFVGWEGLVYPQLAVDRHHRSGPTTMVDTYKYAIAGADWGWIDPTVLLVGLVGFDNMVHVVEEYYRNKTPIETIIDITVDMHSRWGIQTMYCDPSRPEYIQALRNAGIDARKGKNELDPGIAAVNRYLDHDLLFVDFNACPNVIEEFETYHYDEDDLGKIMKDRPVDQDNHAMDALRYMVYSHSRQGYVGSQRGFR
jgi:PBSX family phage terminase large subunit